MKASNSGLVGRMCVALSALVVSVGCEEMESSPLAGLAVSGSPPVPAPIQYTLTVATDMPAAAVEIDERGVVSRCPRQPGTACELRYLGNETLTLTATAPAGSRFDRWSGCEVSGNATVVIRMPQRDIECRAHFFPFDDGFDVSVLPERVVTAPGVMATARLTLERGSNFAAVPIDFRLIDPPAGISLIAPAAGVSADSAALALNVPAGAAPGHYLLTLGAEAQNRLGQAVARTVRLAVDVTNAGKFYVSVDTPTLSISPGASCRLTTFVHREIEFQDPVDFTASPLPPGVSASFDPDPSVGNTELTLTADAQAPFGEHETVVAGHAGSRQSTATLRLAVTAARDSCASGNFALPPTLEDFAISVSPSSVTLAQGEITAVDLVIDRSSGYLGEVFFTVTGAPPGTFAKFDPATPTFGNSKRLILLTSPTATPGSYPINITATGGGRMHPAWLDLDITANPLVSCGQAAIADSFASATGASAPPDAILEVSSRDLQSAAKTYLAFDAGAEIDPAFDKVEFVIGLYSNDWAPADPDDNRSILVYGITDNRDWDLTSIPEATLDWNNAPKNNPASPYQFLDSGSTPAESARVLGSFAVEPDHVRGKLYRVDVTDYVRRALGRNATYSGFATRDTDGILTFMLGNNRVTSIGSSDYTRFYPRESAATTCEQPHLEVYR